MSPQAKRTAFIVVGLGLVVISLSQWAARQRLEHRYQDALTARKQLELELGELRADRERLSEVLATEQQRVAQLSATLTAKDVEQQEMMDRLVQEERLIQELQGRLLAMQLQFDRLQGELAVALQGRASGARPTAGKMVQLERVVVTHAATSAATPGLQGRVISFDPEWRFVVVDLGWDVVNIGDTVAIYRNDQLLGKARIERVQEQMSAAALLPEWVEAEIQVNDVVRVL